MWCVHWPVNYVYIKHVSMTSKKGPNPEKKARTVLHAYASSPNRVPQWSSLNWAAPHHCNLIKYGQKNESKNSKLTPFKCRYLTTVVTTSMTLRASRSEKNFCLRILSSSSPPFINSVTRYTCCESSKVSRSDRMLGCWPCRSKISISSRQSRLLLSMIFTANSTLVERWMQRRQTE